MKKSAAGKKSISGFSIAERLKYLRTRREMTQSELAKKAKISQSSVTQIEAGKKDPSIQTVKALAKALDIHPAVLFAEDEVHVFDLIRMRRKYKKPQDLNDTMYRALAEVVRFAKEIGM